ALAAGEAEQALLQDGIVTVPQRDGEAQPPVVVRDSGDAVLAPPVRPRARVVVGERVPRRALGAVVLAHRAPLALGQIRSPAPPVGRARAGFLETTLLGRDATLRGTTDLVHA